MEFSRLGSHRVATVGPDASARQIAAVMNDRDIGSVVVVDDGKPVGIVTDRDLVLRVLHEGKDPQSVQATDVMSTPLVTAKDDVGPPDAVATMRGRQIRRLPVLGDDGTLLGIVTLDDLMHYMARIQQDVAELIAPYPEAHLGG